MPDTITQFPRRPQFPIAEISAAAQALIDLLNALGGDVDREEDDPPECGGDDLGDQAWIEWTSMRGLAKRGANFTRGEEGDEDDDPAEDSDDDSAVDDQPCDPQSDDDVGAEENGEIEGWAHPDDHPAELFIGKRPANANNPPDAA